MEYVIVVFLLFAAVLIAAWFYLQRAKARDASKHAEAEPQHTEAEATAPTDRPAE